MLPGKSGGDKQAGQAKDDDGKKDQLHPKRDEFFGSVGGFHQKISGDQDKAGNSEPLKSVQNMENIEIKLPRNHRSDEITISGDVYGGNQKHTQKTVKVQRGISFF
jgi:hypothetical protein